MGAGVTFGLSSHVGEHVRPTTVALFELQEPAHVEEVIPCTRRLAGVVGDACDVCLERS